MLGWFKNLRKKSDNDTWCMLLDTARETSAGITISPDSAMRCTPVFAGVRIRCEVLGSCGLHLYRRDGDSKTRATDHPLYGLLHGMANPWTPSPALVMELEKDSITHGAGFALANRSGEKIVELIRLAPGSVQVETDEATLEPKYTVTLKKGGRRTYSWRDILHVSALDGLSAIRQAAEAIGLCMSMEKHAARLFGAGGRPSGILKSKGRLKPETATALAESWHTAHSGSNSGKTAILEEGLEFQALTFASTDLQFQELRAFQVVEIARALGVPPNLLFDFARATWGNSEQMSQAFLTFTLLPRMALWRGAIARLLSAEEQKLYFAEFLVDELVKAEIAARFEAYSKAITNGILNPNEVRAMENRAPYDGGEQFRVPMNTEQPGEAKPPVREQVKPRMVA